MNNKETLRDLFILLNEMAVILWEEIDVRNMNGAIMGLCLNETDDYMRKQWFEISIATKRIASCNMAEDGIKPTDLPCLMDNTIEGKGKIPSEIFKTLKLHIS